MKLYLIDGSGFLFRSFYGIRPLSRSDGLPTNAVYGVAKKIMGLLKKEAPEAVCVCFDASGPTFRKEIYADYKANRQVPPETLVPQFKLVRELVAAMGVAQWEKCGYEADDLIGTLAEAGKKSGYEVTIWSSDKDLAQLVQSGISLKDPFDNDRQLQPGQYIEKMGIYAEQVVDYLALLGDSSDNIPGVPKIGAKTAARLLGEYGTLANILANAARITPASVSKSLVENRELAELSKTLATIDRQVPEGPELSSLAFNGFDNRQLYRFFQKMEMNDLAGKVKPPEDDLFAAAGADNGEPAASLSQKPAAPAIKIINNADDFLALCARLLASQQFVLESVATSGPLPRRHLVGLGILEQDGVASYIPLGHETLLENSAQLPPAMVLPKLKQICQKSAIIGHDLKNSATILLKEAGWQPQKIAGDTMLAAYILDPERAANSLTAIAGESQPARELALLLGSGKKQRQLPELTANEVADYVAGRLYTIASIHDGLLKKLEAGGMLALYREIELPLLSVLALMEFTGVKIDRAALSAFGSGLATEIAAINQKVAELVGPDLNIASPKQLQSYLFDSDKANLKGYLKRAAAANSTDQETLEQLAPYHPLPQLVLEYRQLSKLQGTYVDALIKVLDGADRVHTSFNQARTATGRLSSSDPNLQNIPVRTELGRKIREAFVAAPGYSLLAADYSQIELRMLAHFSQDAHFIQAYRDGEDIHLRTARELFGEGGAEARRHAKTINFGIVYGLSAFRLGQDLGISTKDAQDYMDNYFGRYPGIRAFMDKTLEEARTLGYVTTLFGRRRYLPGLSSSNGNVRGQAERMAVNTVIQGSAADLIKVAMNRLAAALTAEQLQSHLLLQVHDELVIEVEDGERLDVLEKTVAAMEDAVSLAVPLKASARFGQNWAQAH